MNSFEQNTPNREKLTQIIDNLMFINKNVAQISAIERDVILQNLRDAYLVVLNFEVSETPKMDIKNAKTESIIAEKCPAEDSPVSTATLSEEPILEPIVPAISTTPEEPILEETVPEVPENEEINLKVPTTEPEPEIEPIIEPVIEPEPVVEPEPEIEGEPEIEQEPEIEPESKPAEAPAMSSVPEEQTQAAATLLDDHSDILEFLSAKISTDEEDEFEFSETELFDSESDETVIEESEPEEVTPPIELTEPKKVVTPEPQPVKHDTPIADIYKPKQTLADSLFPEETASKQSLNDLLCQQKEDNSIANKFQHAKVEDLAKAISLNDKFLFIKELFRNESEKFSVAIQKLNNCKTIEEAFEEIELLKKYYFWDTTSGAYLALCDLVRRKFQ